MVNRWLPAKHGIADAAMVRGRMIANPNPATAGTEAAPSATQSALRTLELERVGIAAMETALAASGGLGAPFDAAVALLGAVTGRIIVSGMGKSGHIGRKLAATLASTGAPAYFVHPAEASHGDLGMIQNGDAILCLSWSGETAELADIITYSRRFDIGLVAITANADSTLARQADVALVLPKAEEACPNGLAPTTSTTMQLALGDALAVALLEARGFTARDFQQFHPGGKLGARLAFVRDVMHKGEAIPLTASGTTMEIAILEMTGKRLGCVCIADQAGRLLGIVTDGDLRRHMQAGNLMTRTVDEVMTSSPMTIGPDALAAEALAILNASKRSVLIVVDGSRKPVGVLHIHDLYQIGVA
jgi:arabinose-5-phosphate isomerase